MHCCTVLHVLPAAGLTASGQIVEQGSLDRPEDGAQQVRLQERLLVQQVYYASLCFTAFQTLPFSKLENKSPLSIQRRFALLQQTKKLNIVEDCGDRKVIRISL